MALAAAAVVGGLVGLRSGGGSVPTTQADLVHDIIPAQDEPPTAAGSVGASAVGAAGGSAQTLTPATPGETAQPALPSVSNEPPLRSHEVFGFAPYWSLADSSGFDLAGLTTVDYFSIGINPDGTLAESGPGWDGFESQQFIDLVDRAHAAGDRVVVTVNDFDQSSLDALTSSPAAADRLAQEVLGLVRSKSLDGANLDLEGEGSGDQAGLTDLVTAVSAALHGANPAYQLTLDTYASSAGDPAGYYDIRALSRVVDGFFVMAYELNLKASPSSGSPLTSGMFSNQTAAQQYVAAVPPSKVILGLPFFGYDWPTANGTLGAQAQGSPSVVTYGQEAASGHPIYWDAVTQTAWTSYLSGGQWHEAFFEDPTSLYLAAQLSEQYGLGGVGIWALGMDGSNDAAMVSALDGMAPASKDTLAGPTSTSSSHGGPATVAAPVAAPAAAPAATPQASPPPAVAPVTSSPSPARTPRPTGGPHPVSAPVSKPPPTTQPPPSYSYQGSWEGGTVTLIKSPAGSGTRSSVGTLVGFTTNDPELGCLATESSLGVYSFSSDPGVLYVLARIPHDCAGATFSFPGSVSVATTTAPSPPASSETTTASSSPNS